MFKLVQQAYDQIMNERKYGSSGSGYGQSAGGYGQGYGSGGYGRAARWLRAEGVEARAGWCL